MRKTKIICTIGPASEDRTILKELVDAGMNASRHNFSHGDHEEHGRRIALVKEISRETSKPIAIMLDTKGPEIRTGNFNNKVELVEGNEFTLYCGENIIGDEKKCSVSYDNLYKDVREKDTILIDDGLIELQVKRIEDKKIICNILNSGTVSSHKGINVPNVSIKLPAITKKDIEDLKFGIKMGVDAIAASFIRKAQDVLEIKQILQENGGEDILVFSKIENREGVDNLNEILKFSDGIMVARGDLGVEIPLEEVPTVQKFIIGKCVEAAKPVITATQMLDSMIRNPRPTRAEVSDVANAILDGTDSIMLSGETANGKYPVEAVETMAKIAFSAESNLKFDENIKKRIKTHVSNVPNAISLATCNTAYELNADAIITPSQSGRTARIVSKYRPMCPIVGVTPFEKVMRKMVFSWGIFPVMAPLMQDTDTLINVSVDTAMKNGYIHNGDLVVIAAGVPSGSSGSTNMLKVHVVGKILLKGIGSGNHHVHGKVLVVKDENINPKENSILVVKELKEEHLKYDKNICGIVVESPTVPNDLKIKCLNKEISIVYGTEYAQVILHDDMIVSLDVYKGFVYEGKIKLR